VLDAFVQEVPVETSLELGSIVGLDLHDFEHGTNMLCLRRPTIFMLWSVCRDASELRHLTASFDSFGSGGTFVHVVLGSRLVSPQVSLCGPYMKGLRPRPRLRVNAADGNAGAVPWSGRH
jgi:hypothetical protein